MAADPPRGSAAAGALPPAVRAAAAWSMAVILFIAVGAAVVYAFVALRAATATIMFAVVAGGGVAGIVGALLAVPLCAAALGIVSVLRGRLLR